MMSLNDLYEEVKNELFTLKKKNKLPFLPQDVGITEAAMVLRLMKC